MSDCRVPMPTYQATEVVFEFEGDEPLPHLIAKRSAVTGVRVDGVKFERVVRCRDCRYRHIRHCDMNGEYVQMDDYCSFGEAGA